MWTLKVYRCTCFTSGRAGVSETLLSLPFAFWDGATIFMHSHLPTPEYTLLGVGGCTKEGGGNETPENALWPATARTPYRAEKYIFKSEKCLVGPPRKWPPKANFTLKCPGTGHFRHFSDFNMLFWASGVSGLCRGHGRLQATRANKKGEGGLSGPVRDTPSYRAMPFRDSIAEGGIAPICLVFRGYRASIAEIPLLSGGIAPLLRMYSKEATLRKGGGGIAPNWLCWDTKNPIARNRGVSLR